MNYLAAEDVDEMEDDLYLSPMRFDEIKDVAQVMTSDGETDRVIGKLIRHHYHDRGKNDNGVRLFVLRSGTNNETYGVTAIIPNDSWYESLHEKIWKELGEDTEFDEAFRFYKMPNSPLTVRLAREELISRGEERALVTHKSKWISMMVSKSAEPVSPNIEEIRGVST